MNHDRLTATKIKVKYTVLCSITKSKITIGYLECLGQLSMTTINRMPSNASACLVSILIFGIRFSAGLNKCLVAC